MEPLTAISTALASLKTATEIAQLLRSADKGFIEAEYKLKLADMMSSLADTRIAISELKELLISKDEEITNLNITIKSLEINRSELTHKNGLYYMEGDESPFCPQCIESSGRRFHLQRTTKHELMRGNWKCTNCGNFFIGR